METILRRHGDVMIMTKSGFKIPKEAKLKAGKLLYKGLNNSHMISKGDATIGEHEGKKYLRVKKAAIVSHVGGSSTHNDGKLPIGDYWYEIQQFYDHVTEESKKVID